MSRNTAKQSPEVAPRHRTGIDAATDITPYDSEGLLRRTADALALVLDSVIAGLGDESSDGMHSSSSREIAEVSRAISSITGELRAREKASTSAARNLDHGKVMTYLRAMTAEQRSEVAQQLAAMDDEGSVLG